MSQTIPSGAVDGGVKTLLRGEGLMLLGCAAATVPNERADASRRRTPPVRPRLLALGDSYTIGEGVVGRERWPAQLAARLGE
jgi:hypothetical protein